MKNVDPKIFHQLYGVHQIRAVYFKKDFLDYAVMLLITAGVIAFSYGPLHVLTMIGLALCLFLLVTFVIRHGVALSIPLILRRPQDIAYMLIYKLRNLAPAYFFAVAALAAENIFIYFTPALPHHSALMRTIALYLFFLHLPLVTLYQTVSLVSHLRKSELVREFLMQTTWKKSINERTNMRLEIFQAYFTGILTHIILVAPWFFVINYVSFSVLFLPVALVLNVFTQIKWMKDYNEWLYRDHWVSHNSELEFLYLHGTHHDVIPLGMIAAAGNGLLEGHFRHSLGAPAPFFNPFMSFIIYTMDIKGDIDLHQFIPGMFPKMDMDFIKVHQHSMHHYGQLQPYGFGLRLDQPDIPEGIRKKLKVLPKETWNTYLVDVELNGFKWDNRPFQHMLALFEKYREA